MNTQPPSQSEKRDPQQAKDPDYGVPFFSRLLTKLTLGLSALGIIAFAFSTYSNSFFVTTIFKNNFGQNSVLVVQQTIDTLESRVSARIEDVELLDKIAAFHLVASSSNSAFLEFEDIDAVIAKRDAAWLQTPSGTTTAFMREIIENDTSSLLRDFARGMRAHYGRDVYPEIFITNKYGANIAQTGRTTDYYQADEEWWHRAVENGHYISNVLYDESAGATALEIAIAITNENDEVVGVLKALMHINEIEELIRGLTAQDAEGRSVFEHRAHGHASHESLDFTLLELTDEVIYSTHSDDEVLSISEHIPMSRVPKSEDGFFYVTDQNGTERLIAYAHSDVFGWRLVLENNSQELFASAAQARTNLIMVAGFIVLLSILFAIFFLVRYVTNPIEKITKRAQELAQGDYSQQIEMHLKNEIGVLAKSFNAMQGAIKEQHAQLENTNKILEEKIAKRTAQLEKQTEELQHAKTGLEKRVKERTKELEELKNNLEDEVEDRTKELNDRITELKRLNAVMVDRELKMVQLKEQIDELKSKRNGGAAGESINTSS